MPTDAEIQVLRLLSATDFIPGQNPGQLIESLGNEAVTVAVEAALGSYPGLDPKVRTNAVAILGLMVHPQAREAVQLLIREPDEDVAIRALRAAGAQKNTAVVRDLDQRLRDPALPSVIAAEIVKALVAIDSPEARAALADYATADPAQVPHRANTMVSTYLRGR